MAQVKATNESEGSDNQKKKSSCHLQITEKSTKMTKRPKNSFKQDIILKISYHQLQCCRFGMFIPDPNFSMPEKRVKKAPDPGSGSATLISCLGVGGGQPCLPFRRRAKPYDLDHGDGEVLAGAERRIVEGAARLRPPEFQVRIQVDSRPVPGTKRGSVESVHCYETDPYVIGPLTSGSGSVISSYVWYLDPAPDQDPNTSINKLKTSDKP
jgi:hypothetical protein